MKKRLTVDGDAESFALQPCLEVRVHLPTVATTLARRDEKERCVRKLRSGNNGYQTLKRNWISFGVNDASVHRSGKNCVDQFQDPPGHLNFWRLFCLNFRPPRPNCVLMPHASAGFDQQFFCKSKDKWQWLSWRRFLLSHLLTRVNF